MFLDILPPLDGRIGPAEVVFDQKSMVAPLGLRLEPDNLGVSFLCELYLPRNFYY